MYTAHFNLREPPFSIAPDPSFLYLSPAHQEALGHLLYGTGQYGGFVQLVGEVGTGKTTIVRSLLNQKLDEVDVAMIHNPRQSELEFVASICDELGVKYPQPATSIKTLTDALNEHLLKVHAAGRRVVLIIDEAQNLAPEVLEQVRLLTNLETDKEKLLRIMLIGQPELKTLLDRPDLRQLASRITARARLAPLLAEDTERYIVHRLRVAGGAADVFSAAAMRRVHRYTRGIPRLINIVCDRALLGAYAKGLRTVTPDVVDKAATESLGLESTAAAGRGLRRWLPWAPPMALLEATLAIATLVVAGVIVFEVVGGRGKVAEAAPVVASAAAPTPAASVGPAAAQAPVAVTAPEDSTPIAAGLGALRATSQPLPAVMSRLVALWDPDLHVARGDNVCRTLGARHLACYKSHGDWSDLRQMDRPAILTLKTGDGAGETRDGDVQHVLLRGLTRDDALIDSAGGMLRISLDELQDLWTGEFLLLWRKDADDNPISPGVRSDSVLWLRRQLAQAEGRTLVQPVSATFDDRLKQSLQRFQNEHGLDADGIAGTRTLIQLADIGAAPETPNLASAGARVARGTAGTSPR